MKQFLLSVLFVVITIVGLGQEQCIYRVQPDDTEACWNGTAVFTAGVDTLFFEHAFNFKWFAKPNATSGWVEIQNDANYTVSIEGLTTTLLVNVGQGPAFNGYMFKCSVSGLYDSESASLVVNEPPVVGFQADNLCFGEITHFASLGADPGSEAESWTWEFSDGSKYTAMDINHLFAAPGEYAVKLSGTDANGCTGTSEGTVTITPLPEPEILFTKDVFCGYESDVSFYSANAFSSYYWEIEGASQTIVSDSNEIVFNCDDNFPTGQYKVRLTVSDTSGCLNTTEKSFLVLSSKAPVDGYVVRKEVNSNLLVLLIDGQESSEFRWLKIDKVTKVPVIDVVTDKPYYLFDETGTIDTQAFRYGVEVRPAFSDCSAIFYLK